MIQKIMIEYFSTDGTETRFRYETRVSERKYGSFQRQIEIAVKIMKFLQCK